MFLAASLSGYRFTDYVSLGDEFQQNPPVKACSHARRFHTLEGMLVLLKPGADGVSQP